jgi:hypothetical protein
VKNITKRRAYRDGTEKPCLKKTHVQIFELIEEVLIQIHGVVFVSCMYMLNGMFMVLLFLLYIFFLCCVGMISGLCLKSERERVRK